jgi:PTH1 family peptidyl-tRNA hydrolase
LKVIVGLGNPGLRYDKTRHNLGFWTIDLLSEKWQIPLTKHKFQAKYGEGRAHGEKIVLVKPQTFMNRSGESVAGLVNFYQLDLADLLVIYDDLSLAPGMLRIRGSGSAGGHNGVTNIIHHLKSSEFPRLRLGIGSPPPYLDAAEYVLQGIDNAEIKILEDACQRASEAVELWLKEDLLAAMNHYNRRQTKDS